MEPSDRPYAHARGTFAILYALGLFAAIRFAESLPHVAVVWALGTPHRFTSLVVAFAAASLVGVAVRAVVLIRAVRLPSSALMQGDVPTWKPIVATAAALLAWLAAMGVPTVQSLLLARVEGVEWLGRTAMVTAGVGLAEGFADQVILVACLWLAFTRGRDVTLAPRP